MSYPGNIKNSLVSGIRMVFVVLEDPSVWWSSHCDKLKLELSPYFGSCL